MNLETKFKVFLDIFDSSHVKHIMSSQLRDKEKSKMRKFLDPYHLAIVFSIGVEIGPD